MHRREKEALVQKLHQVFQGAGCVVITHQTGLTVAESNALRRRVYDEGANFKVTKNRLAKIALKGTPYESLEPYFQGPTAMAWSTDPVAPARALTGYIKQSRTKKIEIQVGQLGETQLDAQGVQDLADLPSLDELRGRLVGLIQQPAAKMVGVLEAPGSQVARVLKARADKEGGGGDAEAA